MKSNDEWIRPKKGDLVRYREEPYSPLGIVIEANRHQADVCWVDYEGIGFRLSRSLQTAHLEVANESR